MTAPAPGLTLVLATLLLAVAAPAAGAAEFRGRNPIATPSRLPAGALPVAQPIPVDRAVVERMVRRLFATCCNDIAALDSMLADDFLNKSRVLDNFVERYPRDAKLKVLGIQGVQTLNQHIESVAGAGGDVLVSTIAVVVRSELQFNDTEAGFSRLVGTAEYIFLVKQRLEQRPTRP